MSSFRVNGSCTLAEYQTGALVLYHYPLIYRLKAPLERAQVDKMSIGLNGELHVDMKDRSELVLKPMSKKETAEFHAAHKRKLCALQQNLAKQALQCAKIIQMGARKLIRVQDRLEEGAAAIAGDSYSNFHVVSYELHGTNEEQVERDGFVMTPDFASVLKMADELVDKLEPVIRAPEPPPLLREYVGSDSE